MKARQGFASGVAIGLALMLAPVAWSSDSGSTPAARESSAPRQPRRMPRHGALRTAHPAPPPSSTTSKSTTSKKDPLALQPPPLDHVIERNKLRYILAANDDPEGVDSNGMSVSVNSKVAPVLVPMGQLYALPWAFVHPTQAWRIFTPIPAQ